MSGGEQKQLEIARALLLRPRVILIDEPSIGLSPKLVQEVMGLLRALADDGTTGVWRLGVGSYKGDELHWYRVFALRAGPRHILHRRGLVVSNRRRPQAAEVSGLSTEAAVIELRDGALTIELAMGAAALTGLLAWLEAAPPGFPVDHIA